MLQRFGPVDEGVEHLVVAGRAHVEELADLGLLGGGVLPPGALEVENGEIAVTETHVPIVTTATDTLWRDMVVSDCEVCL